MNSRVSRLRLSPSIALLILVPVLLVSGCASQGIRKQPSEVQQALSELQSDPRLAGLAPEAMAEAEAAVEEADKPQTDSSLAKRLNFLAGRKVAEARAEAEARLRGAGHRDAGHRDAGHTEQQSRKQDQTFAGTTASEAAPAQASRSTQTPSVDTDTGEKLAAMQRQINELSAKLLQSRLNDLQAKPTDRGHLVILEDALFAPGQSQLHAGSPDRLQTVAAFLRDYDDRTVVIEGFIDNVGSEAGNRELAQERADAVKRYLQSQGIKSSRINASGRGEDAPIADNATATGRQLNRRVEILILEPFGNS